MHAFLLAVSVLSATLGQDPVTRKVTIGYTLDSAPAVVTIDVKTNAGDNVWVSIGGCHQRRMFGDVNRVVTNRACAAYWIPDRESVGIVLADARAEVTAWDLKDPPDWMTASLVITNCVRYYASEDFLPEGVSTAMTYKTEKMVFRRVHASGKTWRAGSPFYDQGVAGYYHRAFPYYVRLTNDYYLAIFQTTYQQERFATLGGNGYGWTTTGGSTVRHDLDSLLKPTTVYSYNALRGTPSGAFKGWPEAGHAVTSDSLLQKYRGLLGVDVDLPTEAQWEFACRAGSSATIYTGKSSNVADNLKEVAWYKVNSDNASHPVGGRLPNAWGFHDMLGNYSEVCLDWYEKIETSDLRVEPGGPKEAKTARVTRGGSYSHDAQMCSAPTRYEIAPTTGIAYRLWAPCEAKAPETADGKGEE